MISRKAPLLRDGWRRPSDKDPLCSSTWPFNVIFRPLYFETKFETIILQQIHVLKGTVVAALGKPESTYKITKGNAIIYSFLDRKKIADHMTRAKFIIGRPGYTSVMEMVELGKKALFIPTPGQVEQVYLAKHYLEQGWCYCVNQSRLDLENDITKALAFDGFPDALRGSKTNVRKLINSLFTIHSDEG